MKALPWSHPCRLHARNPDGPSCATRPECSAGMTPNGTRLCPCCSYSSSPSPTPSPQHLHLCNGPPERTNWQSSAHGPNTQLARAALWRPRNPCGQLWAWLTWAMARPMTQTRDIAKVDLSILLSFCFGLSAIERGWSAMGGKRVVWVFIFIVGKSTRRNVLDPWYWVEDGLALWAPVMLENINDMVHKPNPIPCSEIS